jgi:hypothetical protein
MTRCSGPGSPGSCACAGTAGRVPGQRPSRRRWVLHRARAGRFPAHRPARRPVGIPPRGQRPKRSGITPVLDAGCCGIGASDGPDSSRTIGERGASGQLHRRRGSAASLCNHPRYFRTRSRGCDAAVRACAMTPLQSGTSHNDRSERRRSAFFRSKRPSGGRLRGLGAARPRPPERSPCAAATSRMPNAVGPRQTTLEAHERMFERGGDCSHPASRSASASRLFLDRRGQTLHLGSRTGRRFPRDRATRT